MLLSLHLEGILACEKQSLSPLEIKEQMANRRFGKEAGTPPSCASPRQGFHVRGHTLVRAQHEPAFSGLFLEVLLSSKHAHSFKSH